MKRTRQCERIAIGYVRCSTEDQTREGVTLDAQRERIAAYGIATGRTVAEILADEGASAKSLSRPALQRLLSQCRDGRVSAVIVLKLDRLTRSVRDLADLLDTFQRHDVALVSVTESLDTSTAAGRLMLNLLASVSQWEREAISERTEIALSYKRRSGQVYAPTPFGYKRDGLSLVPDLEQQAALTLMRDMRADGASYREIAAALERAGIAPRGRRWYAASVRAILSSRMASGAA